MSGVGIGDPNSAVKEIPRPSSVPQLQSLSSIKYHSFVFFNLETTGLGMDAYEFLIIQNINLVDLIHRIVFIS